MTIPARLNIVTLGVSDLPASIAFYERLGWKRASASNDDIAWFPLVGSVLGLFPRAELAADAAVPDSQGPNGDAAFRGVTLAINLETEEAVDSAFETAIAAGATVPKSPEKTDWGGYSGYFADPDGHLWEVAHNPFFEFTPDGRLDLD